MGPVDLIRLIMASPFIDRDLWLTRLGGDYQDLEAASRYLGIPVQSRPVVSRLFDATYYLEQYADVQDAGADPLIHFITDGCQEGRSPHPLVDIAHIRRVDAYLLSERPSTRDLYDIIHYDLVDPGPYFSLEYYREQLAERSLEAAGLLEHFLTSGLRSGIRPNPFLDPLWYYKRLDGASDVESGLRHFVRIGDPEGWSASLEFSGRRYLDRYPDVADAGVPALMHYMRVGRQEGRACYSDQSGAVHELLDAIGPQADGAQAINQDTSARLYGSLRTAISEQRQAIKDTVNVRPAMIHRAEDPLRQMTKIRFPRFSRPRVSILIPVYNEINYTIECLLSIRSSKPLVSYEVVIADDASTEDATWKLAGVPNVKYIRQPSNVGFLRNCNHAFQECSGEYVLLLNNDAQLMPGALNALVDVLDQNPDVAACGPKMLYPDGRLQEAGCTIDRDGVTTMVGLFSDPADPGYNYARDVHYCSGACLLIRRAELGGLLFDETFVPAYCEDTDLCLRFLSKGRRILYCPDAEIVHHLSVSTNRQSVIKRMQLVTRNQQKLTEKWTGLLEDMNRVRVIAFYLPQFHPTDENDYNWGKGFTEWTNVAKAKPAFAGHYQPHLPADLGFYDLRIKQTIESQAALARRYGVTGFCVYYYNFGGRRALDKAFEAIVADQSIDFPYCVCWANENWTRHWDGGTKEPIFTQEYDLASLKGVISDAVRYAGDPRYLRVNGKPIFMIYRPLLVRDIHAFTSLCRDMFREAGFAGVHLVYVESMETIERLPRPDEMGFDACVEFPPQGVAVPSTEPIVSVREDYLGLRFDYEATVLNCLNRPAVRYKRYPAVFPSWDNMPRQPSRGHSFVNSSPEAFQVYCEYKLDETLRMFVGDERLMFVNAWNEWAEGTHLEPDVKFGHRWLEALHNALLTRSLT